MLGVRVGGVGGLCVWLSVHYPWCVIEGEFASACSNRKRHYVQASFPCVFFCLLIMHVCSNNLALCVRIIEVTSGAPHKAKHREQRLLGLPWTWFDFFLHWARERQWARESEREMLRLCPACDTRTLEGLGGIMTVNLSVLMSAPMEKMDYASSCLFE